MRGVAAGREGLSRHLWRVHPSLWQVPPSSPIADGQWVSGQDCEPTRLRGVGEALERAGPEWEGAG